MILEKIAKLSEEVGNYTPLKDINYMWKFQDGFARVQTTEQKYSYLDPDGNLPYPLILDKATDFSEARATISHPLDDENFMCVDSDFECVSDGLYEDIGPCKNGFIYAADSKLHKYGYYDKDWNGVLPHKYDYAESFVKGPNGQLVAKVGKASKLFFINSYGEKLPLPGDVIIGKTFDNYGLVYRTKNGVITSALIDKNFNILGSFDEYPIEQQNDKKIVSNGIYLVKGEEGYGLDGAFKLPCTFFDICLNEYLILINDGDKRILMPIKYLSNEMFKHGIKIVDGNCGHEKSTYYRSKEVRDKMFNDLNEIRPSVKSYNK